MKQHPLDFEPRARATDPSSSHAAADELERSGRADRQLDQVQRLVRRYPGRTSKMLATMGRVDRYMVARRLSELERQGRVRRRDAGGGAQLTWWP